MVSDPSLSYAVDTNKQRTAFPPNFVHALDSSHMLLTAMACANPARVGDLGTLTFAAVHDSYWTHAGCVPEMSSVLRNEFISLYKDSNVLDDFYCGLSYDMK